MSTIACIGAAHVDAKAFVDGPVVPGTSNPVRVTRSVGGVACNVARAIGQLGGPVRLVAPVAADADGAAVEHGVAAYGVTPTFLAVDGAATATYTAVIDGDGALAVGLADMAIYDAVDESWAEAAVAAASEHQLWVVDANLPTEVIEHIVGAAGDRTVLVDPVSVAKAPRLATSLGGVAVVFPDAAELEALSGVVVKDVASAEQAVARLHERGPAVAATLGGDGVVVAQGGAIRHVPAVAAGQIVDVTGAGDAFLGGYAHALVAGLDPVEWGLAVASFVVESSQTIPVFGPEDVAARYRTPT